MRLVPGPDGEGTVELNKLQTRKLLEASYILKQIARNVDSGRGQQLAADVAHSAAHYGAKHVDANGHLIETPREAAVTASSPD